jgi:chromosome segregation ATPase
MPRLTAPGSTAIAASGAESRPQAMPPNTTEPPAVTGSRLPAADTETATEKALVLAQKLNEAVAERKRLAIRVEELEASGKVKDLALDQARAEIQSARTEMARARQELEQWKLEITALRDKLRGADEENLQTLQTAVSLLQQILIQAEDHEPTSAARNSSSAD